MRYLLDTHILVWMIMDMPELSLQAKIIINERRNQLFYSTISVWEVAIKHKLHPQSIPCSGSKFITLCQETDITCLTLQNHHILALENLSRATGAPQHKDPFDQILISQAIAENMIFLTHDKTLQYYTGTDIKIV